MESFGFISGVTQEGRETLVVEGFVQGRLGFHRIGLGAAIDRDAEDQVIGGIGGVVATTVTS